ncbi:MAG: hypothetical protein IH600_12340 [Bacteroidetes bacterium]|nr:hypothetical protein [Bacteroidota bacterium]
MDRIALIILIVMLAAQSLCAQYRETSGLPLSASSLAATGMDEDSLRSVAMVEHAEAGAVEKVLYLTGATLGFALFDYIGYNLVRDDKTAMPYYRVLQGLVQLGISWFLYEQVGLPTAIGFNLIWWTWGADAIFYGYTELFNVGGSWRGRGVFEGDIMNNNCTWASWTPVGITRGMDPEKKIAGNTLVAQSLVGAALAVTITLRF